jgi:hypothetical protein
MSLLSPILLKVLTPKKARKGKTMWKVEGVDQGIAVKLPVDRKCTLMWSA